MPRLWDNNERYDIHRMGRPEGKEKGTEETSETTMTTRHQATDLRTLRETSRLNDQKTTPLYIIFKLQKIKDKEKNSERSQSGVKKHLIFRGTKIRITSDFSSKRMQTREWSKIFKVFRETKPINLELYPAKLSFTRVKGTFSGKQIMRKLAASRSTLQEMFKNNTSQKPIYIKKGRPSKKEQAKVTKTFISSLN